MRAYIARLESNLANIVRFWLPATLDRKHGGYVISHDAWGVAIPDAPKGIVTQARQLWLFSRLARADYRRDEMLDAAAHGFAFLCDRFWDGRHGGFFWCTDASGAPTHLGKHLYGQAFGLFALAEYARASASTPAHDLAAALFALLEEKAHDGGHGGYREFLARDWSRPASTDRNYIGGGAADVKLMNTHLHILEALTAWHAVAPAPLVRRRLLELVAILSDKVVRHEAGACTDVHAENWTPASEPARRSYGHDLENVWLLSEALRTAGLSVAPYLPLFESWWTTALRDGFDTRHGGLWHSGPLSGPADDRRKIWWVQAEAALSALAMFRHTAEPRYAAAFALTYDFIDRYQTDWDVGEWHEVVGEDLRPGQGGKAHYWKAGYHSGRAMIESLEILRILPDE